ncbi:MAG: hypothetical protein QM817_05230 [Archangium sp.]
MRGATLEELSKLYAVTPEQGRLLVLRALLDVESGGTHRVADADEPSLAAAVFDAQPSTDPLTTRLRGLIERLKNNAAPVTEKLRVAAEEFEKSPDRSRDEWLRRLAIVAVLALTAFFYLRESNKPKVVLLPRPMLDAGVQQ